MSNLDCIYLYYLAIVTYTCQYFHNYNRSGTDVHSMQLSGYVNRHVWQNEDCLC